MIVLDLRKVEKRYLHELALLQEGQSRLLDAPSGSPQPRLAISRHSVLDDEWLHENMVDVFRTCASALRGWADGYEYGFPECTISLIIQPLYADCAFLLRGELENIVLYRCLERKILCEADSPGCHLVAVAEKFGQMAADSLDWIKATMILFSPL